MSGKAVLASLTREPAGVVASDSKAASSGKRYLALQPALLSQCQQEGIHTAPTNNHLQAKKPSVQVLCGRGVSQSKAEHKTANKVVGAGLR